MWWPICSSIQINLIEFHQGKVILEISLFLHLCVTVLSVPVGCHWLWGIASLYSDMLHYSSLKWVWFQISLNPWQTRLILTGWLAQMGTSSATATQQSAGCFSDSAQSQPWYLGECTCSWQESFTIDKFWRNSFDYSFTKTKGGITPREGIKRC